MFFSNLLKSKPVDSAEIIHREDGTPYPLVCDAELLRKELEVIHVHLTDWILKDIETSRDVNVEFKRSLAGVFANINLKLLPMPEVVDVLDNISHNPNEQYNRSYARWQDTVVRISMYCDPVVLDVLRNRFVDCMVYGIGSVQGERISKNDWFNLLAEYPWLYLLAIVQDIVENNTAVANAVGSDV